MIAAGLGQSYMVSMLLAAGADVLALDPRMGASALHKAAQSGNADVIGFLSGLELETKEVTFRYEWTPTMQSWPTWL